MSRQPRRARLLSALAMAVLCAAAGGARAQCNAPPLPAPGETVRWLASGSPFEICGIATIPAGGTVEVEPGVRVDLAADATLELEGTLAGAGTAAAPITLAGASVWPPILRVAGTLDLRAAVVEGQIRPASGGTLLFDGVTFRGNGMVFAPDFLVDWSPPFLRFERCRFEGATSALTAYHCTLVARDCDFLGAGLQTAYSYAWLDDLRVDGAPGHGIAVMHDDQPMYLDNLTVRNCASGGLQVGGSQAGNDFMLGPGNVLEGNGWPLVLGDGGLVAGSVVPTTGNLADVALLQPDITPRGPVTLPKLAVPYQVDGAIQLGWGLAIDPGVEIRFARGAGIMVLGGGLRARGRALDPIRLVPSVPGERWGHFGAGSGDSKLEHAVVSGSENGVSAAGAILHVESTKLQGNGWGVQASGYNPIRVRGSWFIDNDVGAITDLLLNSPGTLDLDGATNPNSFVGNGVAVQGGDGQERARHCWWGSATGPRAPTNPSGTGDPIGAEVLFEPYRTSPPDDADAPPFVRLAKAHFLAEPGSTQVLRWEVEEDRAITSQRVVLASAGEYEFDVVIAADLPPDQRSLTWTVPEIGYQPTCLPAFVRVIAVDDAGQEGWDQSVVSIRSPDWIAAVRITTPLAGTYRPGDRLDVCFETTPPEPWQAGLPEGFLFLDGDRRVVPLGGPATSTGCLPLGVAMPHVSTDSARIGIRVTEGCNRIAWAFSECFAIRPDPRVPDAPPVIDVASPRDGDAFEAGAVVPVRWTASDDEGLRSFDVLASYDDGRTWHEIVSGLPSDATSFDWTLPAGAELASVVVRVIARDVRFQDSSNGCGARIVVTGDCASDADGDGVRACDDCAPGDATAWAPPGEDRMLLWTSKTDFAWAPPVSPGADVLTHDVLRTRVPSNFVDAATCLVAAAPGERAADAELPGRDGLFCYLVRARNPCGAQGVGSIGRNSFGVERAGRDCP